MSASPPTVTHPLPAVSREPAPAEPRGQRPTVSAPAPAVTQPMPAISREPAPAEPRGAVSAPSPAVATAAASPSRHATPARDPDGAVAITFATNSSYFPPGVRERLDGLLGGLEPGKRYRVEVEVAVSGAAQVVGAETAEEARRYNRWLAERRLERVQEWLGEAAGGRELALEPRFVPNDNSRRLVVRITPAA
jgi:hypothetical protein